MKLHVLSLCLAGTLATGLAATADHHEGEGTSGGRMRDGMRGDRMRDGMRSDRMRDGMRGGAMGGMRGARSHRGTPIWEPATRRGNNYVYWGERLYSPMNFYRDFPTPADVAQKVSQLVGMQKMEVASLTAQAARARTAGFENIPAAYEHMIADHQMIIAEGTLWLTDYGFPVPGDPAPMNPDVDPHESIHMQLQMHQQMFDQAIAMRQNERSATVRSMLLWAANGAAHHISLLNMLDGDVHFGRRNVSARLQAALNPPTDAAREESINRILQEDREYFQMLRQRPPTGLGNP